MLLWPPRRRADLAREAAGRSRAVAELVEAEPRDGGGRGARPHEAVDALGRRLLGTQHRPTGPTGPMAALASLPDELDWLLSFLAPGRGAARARRLRREDVEALAAAAAVLRASAARLEGGDAQPDFQRLDTARDAVARALIRRLPELPLDAPTDEALAARSRRRSESARSRTPPARSPATHC